MGCGSSSSDDEEEEEEELLSEAELVDDEDESDELELVDSESGLLGALITGGSAAPRSSPRCMRSSGSDGSESSLSSGCKG